MEDFTGLPDPFGDDGDDTESAEVPNLLEPPVGHPTVSEGDAPAMCPFAAIQAALNQRAIGSSLDAKPEGIDLSGSFRDFASETSVAQTGHVARPKPQPKPQSNSQVISEFKPQLSLGKLSKLGSMKEDNASQGPSARSASKASKSKYTKSKYTKKTGASANKRLQGAVSRTRKPPTFSSWEAQTYIPPIKQSWVDIQAALSMEDIGTTFFDTLLSVGGQEIEHMFTTERSIMGVKFAEMLQSIVTSVDNPYSMYQKLQGLAPMHIEKGVGKEHLPIMGKTLFSVLELALKDKLTVQVRTAWEWLWAWLGATFTQSIEEAGNEMTVISQSWNMAVDNFPDAALGELLYDTLFELAPNLKSVFNKPRQILSVKFVEMMASLVSFHNKLDDTTYNEQLVWLGIRHVSYGAKFSHVDVLAQVLLATVSTAVGEEWTEEMEEAWKELWTDTCRRLLNITLEAEKHGRKVQEMWRVVQQRTSRAQFGTALRKLLLSGTEWVQSLSSKRSPSQEAGAKGKGEEANKKPKAPSKIVAKLRRLSTESVENPNNQSTSSQQNLIGSSSPVPSADGGGGEKQGENKHDSEAIGHQFWEFITVVLDLLWEPERQNEQLILMTTRFYKAGIRIEHLDNIGSAIETSCRRSLDQGWSEAYKDAWGWTWKNIRSAMARTLQVLESEHAAIVRESWDKCRNKLEVGDLGELIFKELASVAPYLVHLFKRPKRIQAAQFVSAVDILVSFLEDPDSFFVELKKLTIRHIKYGVKADYAKAFGTAILRGVKNAIGKEDWTPDVQAAWELLWDRVSNCLTRCLNAGTNLVIVALVNGDLDKAKEAMDCAPRGERFDTLTRVDVNGEVLSPLYWAIRDGMRDIALFLLEDLLTIRADRHAYYYGREKLFETHPDIVEVLCKDPGAEQLLDTLFNGLMWHSSAVAQGRLRVNYYIKELYGDPEQEPNVWKSALATLALHAPAPIFEHPVVTKLLQSKWDAFGKVMFYGTQGFYLSICVLYYVAFVADHAKCGTNGIIRLVVAILAAIGAFAQGVLALRQWRLGLVGHVHLSWPGWAQRVTRGCLPALVTIPRTLMNPWNLTRVPTYVCIAFVALSEVCLTDGPEPESSSARNYIMSLIALVVGVQVLEVLMMQLQVASFLLVIQILLPDVFRALLLAIIMLISFSGALVLYKAENFMNLGEGVSNLISLQLGMEIGMLSGLGHTGFSITLASILVVGIQIVVLNVLIAQLVNKASGINRWAHLMVSKKFAYTCVEMESLLTCKRHIMLFKKMGFDTPLDFENGDDGPSGGVQDLELASIRSEPKYVPDRIMRFTGEASEKDPWPSRTITPDDYEDDGNDSD